MSGARFQLGPGGDVAGFRWKLLVAVGVVVSAVAALGLYAAGRNATARAEDEFQHGFERALAALHHVQEMRYQEIAGRCDALVRNPRIHAALEDDALDLLYFNARDQLHDLVYGANEPRPGRPATTADAGLRATFYRFLDAKGTLIQPPTVRQVGELTTLEERQLAVATLPDREQTGYLLRTAGPGRGTVNEVVTVPIASSETGENIAALMVGFEPFQPGAAGTAEPPLRSGVWVADALSLPTLDEPAREELNTQLNHVLRTVDGPERRFTARVAGAPCLVFYKRLNPGSIFPPAYEVCVYPLAPSLVARRRLLWRLGGLGALVLLAGLLASHLVSRRFAAPVERLAVDSAENQLQRARAEAALESTSRELQRSARFSADASHQLKTPVTVLRAGLEELLARDHLPEESRNEIYDLIHQTYRLNGVIEDLLLLSRMDSGRLRLEPGTVCLVGLVEGWLDDLSALPDPLELRVDTDLPSGLAIAGEKRYTSLIVQNLLENARKYNRTEGRIHVAARRDGADAALLVVGNTGRTIAPAAREHIFERFHRGTMGEDVPGHGLGLNLARELARLHGGDLRLVHSADDWTEFEVRFRRLEGVDGAEGTQTGAVL